MKQHSLNRICVGMNLADESRAALRSAATLARLFGAHVDLIAVVEQPPTYARVLTPVQSHLIDVDAVSARASERLQDFAKAPDLDGLGVETHVRLGVPFAELLACCRECSGDLLVVGTRARTGLDRFLLGSTAERVLRKARVPVLVAKQPLVSVPSKILVPTDFSDASRPAIVEAVALARRANAELALLHVIEPVAHLYGWAGDLAGSEIFFTEPAAIEPEWEAFVSQLDLDGVRWQRHTTKGDVVPAIAGTDTDLIVMGTHGRSALTHAMLGSVAEGVVRTTDACVLTVRPDASIFTPA